MHDCTADVGQVIWSFDDPMSTDFNGVLPFAWSKMRGAIYV